jgi:hypothetical protein
MVRSRETTFNATNGLRTRGPHEVARAVDGPDRRQASHRDIPLRFSFFGRHQPSGGAMDFSAERRLREYEVLCDGPESYRDGRRASYVSQAAG